MTRSLFIFVFLFFILESVLTVEIPRYKLALFGLALRKLKIHKEKLRELQMTTDKDEYESDETIPPSAAPYSNSTGDKGQEIGNANTADDTIEASTPVSTKGTETDIKNAGIQIMKFHNFKTSKNAIKFGVFFFFFNRPIPKYIIFRLRISYSYRLRNLYDGNIADTVRTTCLLKEQKLIDKEYEEGKTVNYICDATASQDLTNLNPNITLNTDVDMVTVDGNGNLKTEDFSNVNFNSNSSYEAMNLQENNLEIEDSISIGYLRKGVIVPAGNNILKIKGSEKTDIGVPLKDGEEILMIFKTSNKRGVKSPEQYSCKVNKSNNDLIFDCDISSKSINTSNHDLHLSISNDTSHIITIQMLDFNDTTPIIISSSNNIKYIKNSSGLTGGAIACIVIACTVVLAAASISYIMLSKKKTLIDNTTVVGLKTVDNL